MTTHTSPSELDRPRRSRARGTDTSFASQPDPRLASEIEDSLDEAFGRGIELFEAEMADPAERRFYSGRRMRRYL